MAGAGNDDAREEMLREDYEYGKQLYNEYLTNIYHDNSDDAESVRQRLIAHINKYLIILHTPEAASPAAPILPPSNTPMPLANNRRSDAPLGRWRPAASPVRPVARPALPGTLPAMWGQGGRRKNKNRTRRR